MKRMFGRLLVAATLVSCAPLACIPDAREPSTVERGQFRFQGLSDEAIRWHLRRYSDFSETFGVTLPLNATITMRAGGASSSCSERRVPGAFEYHPCVVPNGYVLECPPDVRECPLRLAEIFADVAGTRSQLLRDGLAEVLAGGVTAPGAYDLEWPDLRNDVIALLDDQTYSAKLDAAYAAYTEDWFYSMTARHGLRRTAAQFVAFLIRRLGPRNAIILMRAHPDAWASMGFSAQQAAADFVAAQPMTGRSYARLAVECAEPEVVLDGDEMIDFVIGSPIYSVLGPNTFHTRVRTLELTEPATVDIEMSGESGPFLYLQDCADGTPIRQAGQFGLLIAREPVREQLRLLPGRYVLIMGTRIPAPGDRHTSTLRTSVTQ